MAHSSFGFGIIQDSGKTQDLGSLWRKLQIKYVDGKKVRWNGQAPRDSENVAYAEGV